MVLPASSEDRATVRRARGPIFRRQPKLRAAKPPSCDRRPELSTAELAFRVYATFRAHPHVSNVLTHISRAKWIEVEQAINSILDPATTIDGLSPLAQNIIDLMAAERGITGKILKPYFHAILHKLVEPHRAERLIGHIEALFRELEWRALHPPPPPAPSESPQQSGQQSGQE